MGRSREQLIDVAGGVGDGVLGRCFLVENCSSTKLNFPRQCDFQQKEEKADLEDIGDVFFDLYCIDSLNDQMIWTQ